MVVGDSSHASDGGEQVDGDDYQATLPDASDGCGIEQDGRHEEDEGGEQGNGSRNQATVPDASSGSGIEETHLVVGDYSHANDCGEKLMMMLIKLLFQMQVMGVVLNKMAEMRRNMPRKVLNKATISSTKLYV